MVGYAIAPIYPIKPLPTRVVPPTWKLIPIPILRVYKVGISNATVIGKPRIGSNVVIIGKLTGIDPETGLLLIKAEKVFYVNVR